MPDFYDVLGVPREADDEQIRRAYRSKIGECHPDRPNGDSERARMLDEARRTLLDPTARAQYDRRVGKVDLPIDETLDMLTDLGERVVEHVGAAVQARGLDMLRVIRGRVAARFRRKSERP